MFRAMSTFLTMTRRPTICLSLRRKKPMLFACKAGWKHSIPKNYGVTEIKYPDKTIRLFCLPDSGRHSVVTWYFQLEFGQAKGSRRCLPGVLRIKPETVYRIPLGGVFPFVKVLEQIKWVEKSA